MLKKGDYVVYGNAGICLVEDTTHLDLAGVDKEKLYYVLQPIDEKHSKVYSPVNSKKVRIRKALDEREAQELIDEIPEIEKMEITSEKYKEESFKTAMKTCDCREWIKIIKTLYLRKQERVAQGKKITNTDEKYLRQAEESLYSELAFAMGKDKAKMEFYIESRIKALERNV